jgi:hypothetical protein
MKRKLSKAQEGMEAQGGAPQDGGNEQMQQVMQMAQQMAEEGAEPQQIATTLAEQGVPEQAIGQVLVQLGLPEEQVAQLMQGGKGQPQMKKGGVGGDVESWRASLSDLTTQGLNSKLRELQGMVGNQERGSGNAIIYQKIDILNEEIPNRTNQLNNNPLLNAGKNSLPHDMYGGELDLRDVKKEMLKKFKKGGKADENAMDTASSEGYVSSLKKVFQDHAFAGHATHAVKNSPNFLKFGGTPSLDFKEGRGQYSFGNIPRAVEGYEVPDMTGQFDLPDDETVNITPETPEQIYNDMQEGESKTEWAARNKLGADYISNETWDGTQWVNPDAEDTNEDEEFVFNNQQTSLSGKKNLKSADFLTTALPGVGDISTGVKGVFDSVGEKQDSGRIQYKGHGDFKNMSKEEIANAMKDGTYNADNVTDVWRKKDERRLARGKKTNWLGQDINPIGKRINFTDGEGNNGQSNYSNASQEDVYPGDAGKVESTIPDTQEGSNPNVINPDGSLQRNQNTNRNIKKRYLKTDADEENLFNKQRTREENNRKVGEIFDSIDTPGYTPDLELQKKQEAIPTEEEAFQSMLKDAGITEEQYFNDPLIQKNVDDEMYRRKFGNATPALNNSNIPADLQQPFVTSPPPKSTYNPQTGKFEYADPSSGQTMVFNKPEAEGYNPFGVKQKRGGLVKYFQGGVGGYDQDAYIDVRPLWEREVDFAGLADGAYNVGAGVNEILKAGQRFEDPDDTRANLSVHNMFNTDERGSGIEGKYNMQTGQLLSNQTAARTYAGQKGDRGTDMPGGIKGDFIQKYGGPTSKGLAFAKAGMVVGNNVDLTNEEMEQLRSLGYELTLNK